MRAERCETHQFDTTVMGCLQRKNILYAREDEKEALLNAYRRNCILTAKYSDEDGLSQPDSASHVCGSELVLITGFSGVGKTRLALELQPHVEQDGGFFCSGKFDGLERLESCYPFVQAMADFLSQLQTRRRVYKEKQQTVATEQTISKSEQAYDKIVEDLKDIANTEFY